MPDLQKKVQTENKVVQGIVWIADKPYAVEGTEEQIREFLESTKKYLEG